MRSSWLKVRTASEAAIAPATISGRSEKTTSRVLSDRSIVGHLVADAPDRDDGTGIADLAAQLAHVHIDGSRVAREGVAPDLLEQLIPGQHQAPVLEEGPEQVELLGRELHLLAVDRQLTAAGVDLDVAVHEH